MIWSAPKGTISDWITFISTFMVRSFPSPSPLVWSSSGIARPGRQAPRTGLDRSSILLKTVPAGVERSIGLDRP